MLKLTIPETECWDEENSRFIIFKPCTLRLEHSLISISEWEAKWCVPFFNHEKTSEQLLDYIRCMTLDKNVDQQVFNRLTPDNIKQINDYISAPMTATTIKDDKSKRGREIITSEIIYYWMITFNIPVEFQKWHINRLIMLIRVCSEKNKPNKKKSRSEIIAENRALNAARKARLGTKG